MATCLLAACKGGGSNGGADDHDEDDFSGDGDGDTDEPPPLLVGQQTLVTHGGSTLVTYTPSGAAAVTVPAIAGEIVAYAELGTSAETVYTWAAAGGYQVLAKLPATGFYLIGTAAAQTSATLDALQAQSWVRVAFPNPDVGADLHATCAPPGVLDAGNQLAGPHPCTAGTRGDLEVAAVDLFKNHRARAEPCVSHGSQVACLLGITDQYIEGGPACTVDVDFGTAMNGGTEVGGNTSLLEVQWAIAGLLAGADLRGHKSVINVSMGPKLTATCAEACYRRAWTNWMSGIAALATAGRSVVGDDFVIVISAGNEGLDMTNEINRVRLLYPTAFENVVIATSMMSTYGKSSFTNRSTRMDDTMYAYGDGPCCPETGLCPPGTSFAAPQVTNVIAKAYEDAGRNDLHGSDLVHALFDAAPIWNADHKMKPTSGQIIAELRPIGGDDGGPTGGD
ncbi:MAG TPA: S8/S53 family peptidase, partial [Myxococcota bacterium]|nr:S8/S53 family peptidase [Myxococcota bacterium]